MPISKATVHKSIEQSKLILEPKSISREIMSSNTTLVYKVILMKVKKKSLMSLMLSMNSKPRFTKREQTNMQEINV